MGNLLDRMEPLLAAMPAVKSPEGHVHFKNKLLWTLAILILYFALTNIPLFGLAPRIQDLFAAWRALLAGASGSIVHLGIGPIVTASIVLQLLKGADILQIDTSETRGQVMYMGLQKILILVMIIIEAAPNLVGGFMTPDPAIASQFFGGNLFAVSLIIFLQICIGGVLIFFMDEVVTKWGIGSGVGLFIIAGISQALVSGFINWAKITDQYPAGFFPRLIAIGLDGGNYLTYFGTDILAFVTTIIIFLDHRLRGVDPDRDPACPCPGARCTRAVPGEADLCKCPADDPCPCPAGKYPDARACSSRTSGSPSSEHSMGPHPVSGLMYFLAPINGPRTGCGG